MKKGIILGAIGAVVVAVAVLLIVLFTGEESYRSIQVFETSGTCTVTRDNDTLDAYKNMKLQSGDKLEVGADAFARLKFDDDKYVYLQPSTVISFTAEGTENDSKTVVFVETGSMTTEVQKKLSATSSYDIVTPNTTLSIRGTVTHTRVATDASGNVTTDTAILEGHVDYAVIQLDENGETVRIPVDLPAGTPKGITTEASKLVGTDKIIDLVSDNTTSELKSSTIEEEGITVTTPEYTKDDFTGVLDVVENLGANDTILVLIDEEADSATVEPVIPDESDNTAGDSTVTDDSSSTTAGPLTNDDIGDIVYVDTPEGNGETATSTSDLTNTIDTGDNSGNGNAHEGNGSATGEGENNTGDNSGNDNTTVTDDNSGNGKADDSKDKTDKTDDKNDKDKSDKSDDKNDKDKTDKTDDKNDKDKTDKSDDKNDKDKTDKTDDKNDKDVDDSNNTPEGSQSGNNNDNGGNNSDNGGNNSGNGGNNSGNGGNNSGNGGNNTPPAQTASIGYENLSQNFTKHSGVLDTVKVKVKDNSTGAFKEMTEALSEYTPGSTTPLPGKNTSSTPYKVTLVDSTGAVLKGYEFIGWYTSADDAATGDPVRAITYIPSSQTGAVTLYPGIKKIEYSVTIINTFPAVASFDLKQGSKWTAGSTNTIVYTGLEYGETINLPERSDLAGARTQSYTEAIKYLSDDRRDNDLICYAVERPNLDISSLILTDSIYTPESGRIDNPIMFEPDIDSSNLPNRMTYTVAPESGSTNVNLYAYFASDVQLIVEASMKINGKTMSELKASAQNGVINLGSGASSNEWWSISSYNYGSVTRYYLGRYDYGKAFNIPAFTVDNLKSYQQLLLDYSTVDGQGKDQKTILNNGYSFAAAGNSGAPVYSTERGWISLSAYVRNIVTLEIPSDVDVTGAYSYDTTDVISKTTGVSGTTVIKIAVDPTHKMTLPDERVPVGGTLLSCRTNDDLENYYYLSKEGYSLAGYELSYDYNGEPCSNKNMINHYYYDYTNTHLCLYYDYLSSIGVDDIPHVTAGITVRPIFVRSEALSPTSDPITISTAYQTFGNSTNPEFALKISNITSGFITSVELPLKSYIFKGTNSGTNPVEFPQSNIKRLIRTESGYAIEGETNFQSIDSQYISSNNGIDTVYIPFNMIYTDDTWATSSIRFKVISGIELNTVGATVYYSDIFQNKLGYPANPQAPYDKSVTIDPNEKYHFLGVVYTSLSGATSLKVFDNFNDTFTSGYSLLVNIDAYDSPLRDANQAPLGGELVSYGGNTYISSATTSADIKSYITYTDDAAFNYKAAKLPEIFAGQSNGDSYYAGLMKFNSYKSVNFPYSIALADFEVGDNSSGSIQWIQGDQYNPLTPVDPISGPFKIENFGMLNYNSFKGIVIKRYDIYYKIPTNNPNIQFTLSTSSN